MNKLGLAIVLAAMLIAGEADAQMLRILDAIVLIGHNWSSRSCSMALARTPIGSVLRHVPFLEAAYNHQALERHDQSHLLSGVFSSYAQALAAVPRGRPSTRA